MMAPRAMTAAVMDLSNRSQGEAAFLQRQCARVRSGNACGRAATAHGSGKSRRTAGRALPGDLLQPGLVHLPRRQRVHDQWLGLRRARVHGMGWLTVRPIHPPSWASARAEPRLKSMCGGYGIGKCPRGWCRRRGGCIF
jgi:hypothetical protein